MKAVWQIGRVEWTTCFRVCWRASKRPCVKYKNIFGHDKRNDITRSKSLIREDGFKVWINLSTTIFSHTEFYSQFSRSAHDKRGCIGPVEEWSRQQQQQQCKKWVEAFIVKSWTGINDGDKSNQSSFDQQQATQLLSCVESGCEKCSAPLWSHFHLWLACLLTLFNCFFCFANWRWQKLCSMWWE